MLRKYLLESMTQYELAHKTAQRNAALPIEQGGLGLHSENTAHDRAKAMGFDTLAYHGTDNIFNKFDSKKIGANHIDSIDGGFFFSQNENTASRYGKHVNQFLLKKDNDYEIPTPIINHKFEDPNYPTKDYYNPIDTYDKNNADILHQVRFKDHTSITVKGFKNDNLSVMFKPHHIRSIHAAFDPMRKHESDLLA